MKRSNPSRATLIPAQTRPAVPGTKIDFIIHIGAGSWLFPHFAEGRRYMEKINTLCRSWFYHAQTESAFPTTSVFLIHIFKCPLLPKARATARDPPCFTDRYVQSGTAKGFSSPQCYSFMCRLCQEELYGSLAVKVPWSCVTGALGEMARLGCSRQSIWGRSMLSDGRTALKRDRVPLHLPFPEALKEWQQGCHSQGTVPGSEGGASMHCCQENQAVSSL